MTFARALTYFLAAAAVSVACQTAKQPDCVFDLSQCELPQRHAVDLPPPGVLRLSYKGCMQTCGRFARFHAAMPQQECGGDKSDDCSYSPVFGEPGHRASMLAEEGP